MTNIGREQDGLTDGANHPWEPSFQYGQQSHWMRKGRRGPWVKPVST